MERGGCIWDWAFERGSGVTIFFSPDGSYRGIIHIIIH